MKNITPSELRNALGRRNSEMTDNAVSDDRMVRNILAQRNRRRGLRRRVLVAVTSVAAMAILGLFIYFPSKPEPEPQSPSAAYVVATLARAGIEGDCVMTETRREDADGKVIVSCRVVVNVSKSNNREELLYGQKLTSVTATYDSIIDNGQSYTTLTTELNYTGGLRSYMLH